ncbi:MAG: hypothetical protein PVH88_08125 [Ignavibacteria bacterium]|jgi:hypothetical protein
MKKLKLNLEELKVDPFVITNEYLINKGTAKGNCDQNSNATGSAECRSKAVNCSLQYCTAHTCYQSDCDLTCGDYHDDYY